MLLADFLRHLSVRNPLLMRALGADLAGFQTANHVRHFKQTVPRILAYESLPKGIQAEDPGRFVDVGAFPMGTDVNFERA
ncbi:hypothetical protein PISMIDRAFT_117353 [Pisolithus microcarpus 441]|uniref:Unplaced genomic scaffold scaffold_264, whole genome shotgun sequence n=1 Tax=Pisolithus microcarpus 441 TaxID=765257 RepID=A0A0C9XPE0_9AGAM|nr:hypothetical protein BKA83DRAFT_117353 [Pisolithus microcarpus]KIK14250.1 hypothetical protein PISMIDRAFT_117353 [Pisolithus microcarpus 441]